MSEKIINLPAIPSEMPLKNLQSRDNCNIGVLALQGAFAAHRQTLQKQSIPSLEVRKKEQLAQCAGLILPGGESTAIMHLLSTNGLVEPLLKFSWQKPLFGTCAGLIIMAVLGILDIKVERNSYGSQIASFSTPLMLSSGDCFPGIFIRAPRILRLCSEKIQVLGKREDEIVFIKQGQHLGTTFHPELTEDPSIHLHFAKLCQDRLSLV